MGTIANRLAIVGLWAAIALAARAQTAPGTPPNSSGAPTAGLVAASAAAPASPLATGAATGEAAVPTAAAGAEAATIAGTVLDTNGDLIPGASIVVDDGAQSHSAMANDNAAFQVGGLKRGVPYRVTVSAPGFADWSSSPTVLAPTQSFFLMDVHLRLVTTAESVTVYASPDQIATEQVRLEEQQRILGFVPNFYVVYDAKDAAPMSARLKYRLALRTAFDPITITGVAFMAAVQQAGDTPNYRQGGPGFGQRFGAEAATGFSNILIGGAVLPALLRQDPRYFYQGEGSTHSRLMHALAAPFLARGDNGRTQINYSSLGGDIASSSLSVAYLPNSNRSAEQVFSVFALSTAERAVNALAQEFLFSRFTSGARGR